MISVSFSIRSANLKTLQLKLNESTIVKIKKINEFEDLQKMISRCSEQIAVFNDINSTMAGVTD